MHRLLCFPRNTRLRICPSSVSAIQTVFIEALAPDRVAAERNAAV
jgi:hypothetical protein